MRNQEEEEITDEDLSGPVVDRRTTMKILGLSGAAGATSLAGCAGGKKGGSGEKGGGGSKSSGGTINAGWTVTEISKMDPHLNSIGENEQATMLVFNALFETTPDLRIKGEIAKDWTVENKTKYTFQLREGVQFHGDYGEVTAEDVKYTLMRGLTVKGSTSKPKLSNIKKPYAENITVIDDYTLEVKLGKPFVPFLKALSRGGGVCNVHPKAAVEDLGSQFNVTPIGAGPFKVEEHKVGSKLVLSAFEDYWKTDDQGNQLPHVDDVVIKPLSSPSTLINGLKGGDLNYINAIPLQNMSDLKKASDTEVHKGNSGGWIAMYFNNAKPKFKDKKVRQGVSKLINQKKFVEQAFFGHYPHAVGPLSPVHGFVNRPKEKKPDTQNFNPEQGKKMLKEAGYSASSPLSFTIMANKASMRQNRVLKRVLNKHDILDVDMQSVDQTTFDERLEPKEGGKYYDVCIWGSDIDLTPDTTMYFFFRKPDKGGAYNDMGYIDDKVHKWLGQQRSEFDEKQRIELFHKAEDRVIRDSPCAFLYHQPPYIGTRKEVNDVQVHPFRRPMENITVEK